MSDKPKRHEVALIVRLSAPGATPSAALDAAVLWLKESLPPGDYTGGVYPVGGVSIVGPVVPCFPTQTEVREARAKAAGFQPMTEEQAWAARHGLLG